MPLSKVDGMKPRLLQDFIIPHLEEGTFRDKLYWIDRENQIFRISWKHQSSSKFSQEDSFVFQYWAIAKGLWDPTDAKCHTKAKQRLRAALLKLKSVKLISKDPTTRTYKIISNKDNTFDNNPQPFADPSAENRLQGEQYPFKSIENSLDLLEELETEAFIYKILDSEIMAEHFS